ncbi:MAG: hypothetical protein WCD24_23825 [Serratia inhibens]|uniref:hypothetical protein n=1 Tax=Serratia inhibens TaxID=2338073 RepID=UPI003C79DF86
MTTEFFQLDKNRRTLNYIKKSLDNIETFETFDKERNEYIILLLKSFIEESESWDESTQFNIENISESFINSNIKENSLKEELDDFFSDCFRFFLERYLSQGIKPHKDFLKIKDFAIRNIDNFSSIASTQISYALQSMPLEVFRKNLKSTNLDLIKDFIKTHEDCKTLKSGWDSDYAQRISEIRQLKEALDEQKNAYNFVGLHKGFDDLSVEKKKEGRNASNILIALGSIIFIPIILEIIFIINKGDSLTLSHALITLIPSTSLLLILVYYFRIALHDYKSIKSQINQIELRKSLCQFIQNYAQYSSKIKKDDTSALEKFEAIIFSNIVMTDDKIPSTFDGIESVANLIKSVKGP